jgi:hypothetical protein
VVDLRAFSKPNRDVMLSPPYQWRKPPWDALGENVFPFDPCSYGVCHNSKIEVCDKMNGVVIGRNSFSAGDAADSIRGFLDTEFFMKVVNSIKMKPPDVALWVLWLIRVVRRRPRRVGRSFCRLSRKLECCRPQLLHQHARCSSSCLCSRLVYVGRSRCHE